MNRAGFYFQMTGLLAAAAVSPLPVGRRFAA